MNTKVVYVSVLSSQTTKVYGSQFTIKGATSVYFDLSGVTEIPYKIAQFTINFGDDDQHTITATRTMSCYQETNVAGVSSDILNKRYGCAYYPNIAAYYYDLSAQILLYRDNGNVVSYIQPIRIAQASIYDDLDNITLHNSQIIDSNPKNNLINFSGDKSKYTVVGVLSDND